MNHRTMRAALYWCSLGSMSLVLACFSGKSDYNSSGGWGGDDTSEEPELEPPSADTGAREDPQDTARADTAPEEDTAAQDDCDDETPVVLYMSPDDSNSMSSAAQARAAVLDGWASLSFVAIRGWEFMNYYDFAYEPPMEEDLALSVQVSPAEEGDDQHWLMQVGITSATLLNEHRAPMNLTFVLDTSGSMGGTPIYLLKEILLAADAQLRSGDIVSVVTWNTSNSVLLANHRYMGPQDDSLRDIASSLSAGGSTDLYGGLEAGYALAQDSYDPARINRVVLVSDGGANAGITSLDLIAEQAGDSDDAGIYLVGVGVGDAGSYNDELMDQVTDEGKGASIFIDSRDEAWKMFGTRFVNTFGVAARDVQLELSLPPGFEVLRFSGEGMSSDPLDLDPQHIAPNDSMVFYNELHTCAPALLAEDATVTVSVRFRDAIDYQEHELTLETSWAELVAGETALLHKGRAVYTYAEALKTIIVQSNPTGREETIDEALALLAVAEAANPGDGDLEEIRAVLEALDSAPISGASSGWSRIKRAFLEIPVISALEESRL
jgi:Ca-activated chloride channel family protein